MEHSDYEATVTIDVRPEAELESYDAPEVNMPPEEATEAEIDWQLNQLLSYQMTYEDTDEDREVAEGDVIGVDIQNVEGAGHLAAENRTVTLNGMQLPAELQEAIVGMKPGETKDVEWVKSHEHEGEVHEHKFSVKVTVKAIKKTVTPELTDELAKKNFGYETVEKLREAVKEEIEADKKTSLPQLKEDRVVEEMGKRLQLDEVPENYKNEIFNELAQEFLAQLQRQNISLTCTLPPAASRPTTSSPTSTPRPTSAPASPWPWTPSPRRWASRPPRPTLRPSSSAPASRTSRLPSSSGRTRAACPPSATPSSAPRPSTTWPRTPR